MKIGRFGIGALVFATAMLGGAGTARAQQDADTLFDASVAAPAYPRGTGPRVAVDEGHRNFHTLDGRYRPFATVLASDGYRVGAHRGPFTAEALAGVDVLVIANALGEPDSAGSSGPALTAAERAAVVAWVRGGGALLLVADHEPMGAAVADLGRDLGVGMSRGRTFDAANADSLRGSPSWIAYTRGGAARLEDHPITRGRGAAERVERVVTFTGQSLLGPPGSALLSLAPTAHDVVPGGAERSAAGRSQGVAFRLGAGRVVVLGEAAMLTAQVGQAPGQPPLRFGFTWPGTDNRRFLLNTLHWLSGILD